MSTGGIIVAVDEHAATITIDRPGRRNALDLQALDALATAWAECDADDRIRSVILTGSGEESFSAGADLKEFAPESERHRIGPTHPAFFPERVLLKPLIAAVNGYCLAGGLELLLACDIRIAVPHATFGLPEPRRGLFPAGGSAVRAPRRLGWAAAMEILLTGSPVDADHALRIGLITRIVPMEALMKTARALADAVAECSPAAVRAIKRCAIETDGLPLDAAFERSAEIAKEVHSGPDAAEGIAAFRGKRPPRFGPG